MLKRLITAAVGVVGLVVVGLGVASATVWRADDVLVATATGDAAVVLTEPGVLELGGDPATVTVTAPGDAPLVLAVGRDTDVLGWVGDDAHTTVTGLSDWHALAVEEVPAAAPEPAATEDPAATDPAATDPAAETPAEDPAADAADGAEQPAALADPTGSDLWVAEATGNGSVELEWPAQEGRWSLLAVSTSGTAPTLQLAWPRTVTTPWLWPCVVVGSLLVLGASVVALRGLRRRRAPEPAWTPVTTGSIPAVGAAPARALTRRELREAAARGESGSPTAPAGRPAQSSQPAADGPVGAGAVQGPPASPSASSRDEEAARGAAPTAAPWSPSSRRARREPSVGGPGGSSASSGAPEQAAGDEDATARGTRLGWPRAVRGAAPQGAAPSAPSSAGTAAGAGDARTAGPGRGPWPGATTPDAATDEESAARPGAAHGRPSWAARGSVQPATPEPGAGATLPASPAGPSAPAAGPFSSGPASPPGAATPTPPSATGRGPAGARPDAFAAGPTAGRQPAGPLSQAPVPPPTAPGLGARPGGWSPTLPPPGATVRPGATGGPDAPHAAAGRPAWLSGGPTPVPPGPAQPADPDAGGRAPSGAVPPRPAPTAPRPQTAGDPDAAAARADAWRRAWGLPPGAGAQDHDQQGSSGEEQR